MESTYIYDNARLFFAHAPPQHRPDDDELLRIKGGVASVKGANSVYPPCTGEYASCPAVPFWQGSIPLLLPSNEIQRMPFLFHTFTEAPALFMGPSMLASGSSMDNVGGGRGFVAAHDIAPGTVLCREVPFVQWQGDPLLMVRQVSLHWLSCLLYSIIFLLLITYTTALFRFWSVMMHTLLYVCSPTCTRQC